MPFLQYKHVLGLDSSDTWHVTQIDQLLGIILFGHTTIIN